MKITFFGGSFNPPHYGHYKIGENLLKAKLTDKVLFVVAYIPPHKTLANSIAFEDRYKMVEMLIANNQNMQVSNIEWRLKLNPSYTIDVLNELQKEFPNDKLSLLIGGDSFSQLHTWRDAHKLLEQYEIFTYNRGNEELNKDFWSQKEIEKLNNALIKGEFYEISSTKIRNLLAKSSKTSYIELEDMLPREIAEYVIKKKMYV